MTVIDWRNLPARNGFDLRADKVYDQESRPSDYECYTAKQVAAWERNDWEFVGLVVTASVEGVELGSSSLWSIESGSFVITTEDDEVTEVRECDPLRDDDYLDDLIDEAIDEARKALSRINERIGK